MNQDADTTLQSEQGLVLGHSRLAVPPPSLQGLQMLYIIGRGAYGEVWLARSVTGAMRAVKIVRRSSFEQDRPFQREFEGIRRFEPVSRAHDSQVDILHVGHGDDYFFYVMELGDDQTTGGQINPEAYHPRTLKSDLQNRKRLPFEECVSIAISLSGALQHLHENGLVHRDVKPSNVIFINGVAKLADVGLVTDVESTRSHVGTEGFFPPEGAGTPQGDIYSLGKVLYEMSTGRDRQDFPALPDELRELSDWEGIVELNSVIARACRHDPAERYQTAAEMRAELELLRSGKSLARLHLIQRRLKWWLRAAAALVIIIVALGGGWAYHARHNRALLKLANEKARLAEENARLAEFQRLQLLQGGVIREGDKSALFVGGPLTNAANGHIYYLLGAARPTVAEDHARIMGGTLATVRNAEEQEWIFKTFGQWNGIARQLLIGLYQPEVAKPSRDKENRKKEFVWKSGEPVTYTNWAAEEPNGWEGRNEKYVHIWAPGCVEPGRWNDFPDEIQMLGFGVHGVVEIIPTKVNGSRR